MLVVMNINNSKETERLMQRTFTFVQISLALFLKVYFARVSTCIFGSTFRFNMIGVHTCVSMTHMTQLSLCGQVSFRNNEVHLVVSQFLGFKSFVSFQERVIYSPSLFINFTGSHIRRLTDLPGLWSVS